ncbi:unnamed protein product [Bursaphelenchus okinawaensis]|uniref:DOMON domain-containing protein n=1 Tax=Bursaphelenchus okinawaensis TaxID=465554 RepID=A0A811LNJ3_9BILA|nr:unnamed protein product [Bursaphelenchus okinawaensis]CAG9124497.1 unnamed protein product [Bursaphelenchus okinawaensis]
MAKIPLLILVFCWACFHFSNANSCFSQDGPDAIADCASDDATEHFVLQFAQTPESIKYEVTVSAGCHEDKSIEDKVIMNFTYFDTAWAIGVFATDEELIEARVLRYTRDPDTDEELADGMTVPISLAEDYTFSITQTYNVLDVQYNGTSSTVAPFTSVTRNHTTDDPGTAETTMPSTYTTTPQSTEKTTTKADEPRYVSLSYGYPITITRNRTYFKSIIDYHRNDSNCDIVVRVMDGWLETQNQYWIDWELWATLSVWMMLFIGCFIGSIIAFLLGRSCARRRGRWNDGRGKLKVKEEKAGKSKTEKEKSKKEKSQKDKSKKSMKGKSKKEDSFEEVEEGANKTQEEQKV